MMRLHAHCADLPTRTGAGLLPAERAARPRRPEERGTGATDDMLVPSRRRRRQSVADQTQPNRKVGVILVVLGAAVLLAGALLYLGNVTGLLPTIPYAGSVAAGMGGSLEAVGIAYLRGAPVGRLEQRRTSLVVVIPALVLFGLILLCAALVFGANFEGQTSARGWIVSGLFLLVSTAIVSALVRDIVLRFIRTEPDEPASSESGSGERW